MKIGKLFWFLDMHTNNFLQGCFSTPFKDSTPRGPWKLPLKHWRPQRGKIRPKSRFKEVWVYVTPATPFVLDTDRQFHIMEEWLPLYCPCIRKYLIIEDISSIVKGYITVHSKLNNDGCCVFHCQLFEN